MDLSNMNFTSIAGLTAIGAIIATTWRHILTFGRYIVGLVIGHAILKDEAGAAVMSYALRTSAIKSPFGMRIFGGYESYVHPKRWRETIGYEGLGPDPIIIKHGRTFALLSLPNRDVMDNVGDVDNRHKAVDVRYLRWFFNIEKFTLDAIEHYNNQKRQIKVESKKNTKKVKSINRFRITRYSGRSSHHNEERYGKTPSSPEAPIAQSERGGMAEQMIMSGIYKLLKWNKEDLQIRPEEGQSAFTGYPFPDEVSDAITELEQWLGHEKWFRSKSIPWRRGWLLHGVPGTGKSTLVRALGMSFDLPVFIFDLAGMTNDDLVRSWEEMMVNTPCIALIEDIDNIFDGRKYVGSTNPNVPHLTFDCLLNCISGVKQADGVFLIVTTNHLEKLDAAIGVPDSTGKSSRPGRIDKALHLGLMGEKQRITLAKHILSDCPEMIDETVKLGDGETAAQFQARCAQLALSKFWKEPPKVVEDHIEVMHFNSPGVAVSLKELSDRTADERYQNDVKPYKMTRL